MKKIALALLATMSIAYADETTLPKPDLGRGDTIMQAFTKRHSTKSFSRRKPTMQDLSDLLYAANGINRPESGKRTAPSALNRQDIKIYVCLPEGAYLYNAKRHSLELVNKADLRQ